MSIVTLSLVVLLVVWAPFGLEVEHKVVGIFQHMVNDPGLDVFLRMCKGAEITILTVFCVIWEC